MKDKEEKQEKKPEEEEEKTEPLMGEDDDDDELTEKSSLSKFKPLLVPLAIAVVVGYLMVMFAGVPRAVFDSTVGSMEWEVGNMGGNVVVVEDLVNVLNDRLAAVEVKAGNNATSIVDAISRSELARLTDEIDDLKALLASELADILVLIDELDIPSQNELVSAIEAKFTEYEVRIADMEVLLDEFLEEDEEEEEDEEVTSDITRWTLSAYATNNTDVTVGYIAAPYRIEDGGDYSITLTILNPTFSAITNLTLEVALRPTSGDDVLMDEGELYLDTTQYPYSLWDSSVIKRSDGTCRRIVFNCTGVTAIARAEGEEFGTTVMRLELTLAYK